MSTPKDKEMKLMWRSLIDRRKFWLSSAMRKQHSQLISLEH